MPKVCDSCRREYDGRRTACPFCSGEDDHEFSLQHDRDRQRGSSPRGAAVRHGTLGASESAMDLDRSIDELGDVSQIVQEFRALSLQLTARMDRIETFIVQMSLRLPTTDTGTTDNNQDGGTAASMAGHDHRARVFNFSASRRTDAATDNLYPAVPDNAVPDSTVAHDRAPGAWAAAAAGGAVGGAARGVTQAAIDDGAEPDLLEDGQGGRGVPMSKFDLRRFLPASERKKPLSIDSPEKLIYLLTRLLDDLSTRGFGVSGLLQHLSYITWMALTGIYATGALVEYDYEIRDRAREQGCGAFCGGDTDLSNMFLGASGTKAYRQSSSRSNNNNSGQGSNKQGGGSDKRQGLTGWKRVAADRNICFNHAQGRHCAGCRFKHECSCGSKDHNMYNCPNRDRRGGDGGGNNA